MSLLPLPSIVVNLGVEMAYILKQRLEAQKIGDEKAGRVINDVLRTLFTPALMEELRKPQDLYTIPSIRLLFDRIVHSSIMRLNDQSMDKLYDLILMGLKYQLLSCTTPEDFVRVTETHVETAVSMCTDELTVHMITHASKQIISAAQELTPGQWIEFRHRVMAFVQNKRVKVSLFLQEGLQASDGRFHLPRPAAEGSGRKAAPLGTCRFFDANGHVVDERRFKVDPQILDADLYLSHPERPGANLYRSGRAKVTKLVKPWKGQLAAAPPGSDALGREGAAGAAPRVAPTAASVGGAQGAVVYSVAQQPGGRARPGPGATGSGQDDSFDGPASMEAPSGDPKVDSKAAVERMKTLANVLSNKQADAGAGANNFKLNLFGGGLGTNLDTEDISSHDLKQEEHQVRTIYTDTERQREAYARDGKIAGVLRALELGPTPGTGPMPGRGIQSAMPHMQKGSFAAPAAPQPAQGGRRPAPIEDEGQDLLDLMDGLG